MSTPNRLFTPAEWVAQGRGWPTKLGTWKHILRNRDSNGLKPAVTKIGKTILIDEAEFRKWLKAHAEAQEST